jgi:hypothetical protein
MAPTAIVGRPTSLRMRSANGVWKLRPKAGRSYRRDLPQETSTTSAVVLTPGERASSLVP